MIVEIALCVGAGALAILVGLLVPLLIQLRKAVEQSEYLLVHMNAELPLLLKEMRAAVENLNRLIEHARGGVEHATVLLHAAGALGDTVQRVHETVQGTGRSFLVKLVSMVGGTKPRRAPSRRIFTEKEGQSMGNERACSLEAAVLAFVTGGLAGAAVALLLAPQSGRKSREQVRGYARRAEEHVHELADKATDVMHQAVDKGHEFIKDKQTVVAEAVEAGRAAMSRERERLSGEKTV